MTAIVELSDKERGEKLVNILKSGLDRAMELSCNNYAVTDIVEQVLSESLCVAYNAGFTRGRGIEKRLSRLT